MVRKRLLTGAGITSCLFGALLLIPGAANAQRATGTLIVRVEADGAPAAGIDVAMVERRATRHLRTTGTSGLVKVEQLPLAIDQGTRVSVSILRCDGSASVLLVPHGEGMGDLGEGCAQQAAGSFVWGQTERIVVRLDGDQALVEGMKTEQLRQALRGWRIQGSFLYDMLTGSGFSDYDNGVGGELRVFYTWSGGLGLGAGGSWTKHGRQGPNVSQDEKMTKWSAFLEPRYTLFIPSTRLRPRVFARVSHNWFVFEGSSSTNDVSGFGYGGGIGLAYPVANWLAIDMGAYLGYLSVGDDFPESGTEIQLTAGLIFVP